MGQSKVAKSRAVLPLFLAFLTTGVVLAVLYPLQEGVAFRNGGGIPTTINRRGVATITQCETTYYGLVYECAANVRWETGNPQPPDPKNVFATIALSGEVEVVERVDRTIRRGRELRTRVVPVGQPAGGPVGAWLIVLLVVFGIVPGGLVAWLADRRLKKPVPEPPPESVDLRAAQVARDKARRRRRKTTG